VQSNTALEPTTKKVKKVGFVVDFQKVIGDRDFFIYFSDLRIPEINFFN